MSFIAAIRAIFEIWDKISTIRDLLGGNAASVITIADLERVVRGEHARFFTTIAFADLETIHNQFYNNWLPSIARHDHISANDINLPTGTLYFIFQELIRVRTELSVLLNRVREVFRNYQAELHVDELVDGVFAAMHGFALLFHIHGVYAELRRIQIGATALDDERLLTDTRAALQYIADARAALDIFMYDSLVQNRRLASITPISYYPGGYINPPTWSFADRYSPRSSTPASASLYVYVNGSKIPDDRVARERRNQHVVNVTNRMGSVFVNTSNDAWYEYYKAYGIMTSRQCNQEGGCLRPPIGVGPIPPPLNTPFEFYEHTDGYEYVFTVPFDAEEFVAMSKRLRREEAITEGKEETRRRIRASL